MLKCELSCVLSGLYPIVYKSNDVFDAIEYAVSELNEMIHWHDFNVESCTIGTVAHWKNILQFGFDIELSGTTTECRYDYEINAKLRITKQEDE